MPGELGNEEEQSSVGYYEHRIGPDEGPNIAPPTPIEDMRKKAKPTSVLKVLRDFTTKQMEADQGKQQEF